MINVLNRDTKYDITVEDSYAVDHHYFNVRYNFVGEKQLQIIGDDFVTYYMLDNVVKIHIKNAEEEDYE